MILRLEADSGSQVWVLPYNLKSTVVRSMADPPGKQPQIDQVVHFFHLTWEIVLQQVRHQLQHSRLQPHRDAPSDSLRGVGLASRW